MSEENDLILALDRLKRSAPENFGAVKEALTAYAGAKLRECLLQSDVTQLPRYQGQAQMADKLSILFSEASEKALKIQSANKPKM